MAAATAKVATAATEMAAADMATTEMPATVASAMSSAVSRHGLQPGLPRYLPAPRRRHRTPEPLVPQMSARLLR